MMCREKARSNEQKTRLRCNCYRTHADTFGLIQPSFCARLRAAMLPSLTGSAKLTHRAATQVT
eukprot:6416690-Amphidinium_carterae.1